MQSLNKKIAHLEIPHRLRELPISDEGYPIPYFVPYIDGKPEFRGFDGEKLRICVRLKRCWMCGKPLAPHRMTFAVGPMCMLTRTISEPPSHGSCLRYSVQACPFLSQPKMRRNEKDAPGGHVAGVGIKRNPGVIALWLTPSYKIFRPSNGGVLFELGEPMAIEFYAEGRKATRAEILHSIETGLPLLQAEAEKEGPDAVAALAQYIADGMKLVPKEEPVA